ncbi:CotH kinase family protein [Furfurilactobacillus entadae]|uniref:CotH kinase family protein n=1 Tax=Furfurilactobacillus entadae TaxID=2922307 RepID=UPI0035E8A82E
MKKRKRALGLTVILTVVIVALVGSFTWIHFNTTRQLPLLSSQETKDLPKVKVSGAVSQTDNDGPVVKFDFHDKKTKKKVTAYAKMEWQGQSSRKFPQKNWKLKFYKDKQLKHKYKWRANPGWKKHSVYVLKANYVDATQSRNVVNANLWSQMVATRQGAPKQLASSQNNGAISGFPVEMKVNGDDWGMYTLTTAKEPKLWGMDKKNPNNIAISSNQWTRGDMFWSTNVAYTEHGWTSEQPKTWTPAQKQAFERLDNFVVNSSDKDFKAHASEYLDVNSVIDMYLFTNLTHDQDGLGRNLMLITYDGKHWSTTMYDIDATWGLYENGKKLYPSGQAVSHNYPNHGDMATAEGNRLLQRVAAAYPDRVQDRWKSLRKTTLTPDKVTSQFSTYMNDIGEQNYQNNIQLNPGIPSAKITSLMQLKQSINKQFKTSDALFDNYTENVKKLDFSYHAPTMSAAESESIKAASKASQAAKVKNSDTESTTTSTVQK